VSVTKTSVAKTLQMPVQNLLLAALSRETYLSLLPDLEPIDLLFKQVLYEPRQPMKHVYFPNRGVVSLLTILAKADNSTAEVGLVGKEGMVGIPVFLGIDTTPIKAIVQVSGDAMRMQADAFGDAVNGDSSLHDLLQRYTYGLMFQISQSAACNNYHSVAERCCRWLLMTQERAGSDQFPLTHEFLSQMLGVRRASVTVVAGDLQKAGLIRYSRGQIEILDHPGLEAAACECYGIVKAEFDYWLG